MRKRGLFCRPVSVRPSVRQSVTLVYCIHMVEDIVKFLFRPGSLLKVFLSPSADTQFQREPLQRKRTIYGGNLRFSTEISAYLENDTIGPWCYGTLIGSHRR